MQGEPTEGEHPDMLLDRKQAYAGILFGISLVIVLFGIGILAMVLTSVSWWTTQGLPPPPNVVSAANGGSVFAGGGFIALGAFGMVYRWVRSQRIEHRRRLFWGR